MNETQHIENYLTGTLSPEDNLVMEAKLILDAGLREKVLWQQTTYPLIKGYGRKQLRLEIEAVHARMFSEKRFAGFRQLIKNIFN